MLTRIWNNRNSHSLLVEMQNAAITGRQYGGFSQNPHRTFLEKVFLFTPCSPSFICQVSLYMLHHPLAFLSLK